MRLICEDVLRRISTFVLLDSISKSTSRLGRSAVLLIVEQCHSNTAQQHITSKTQQSYDKSVMCRRLVKASGQRLRSKRLCSSSLNSSRSS